METPDEERKRKRREASARYRAGNAEKVREYAQQYRQEHLEEGRARAREAARSKREADGGAANREAARLRREADGGAANRATVRAWREANPERAREAWENWQLENPEKHQQALVRSGYRQRDTLRADGRAAYGPDCRCCGESEPMFLTFDHPNNDGWTERKNGVGQTYVILARLRREGWPAGALVVLCWNCNCGRHRNGGVCPHKE